MDMQYQESVLNIHNKTNQRMCDRNIPSQMLQPYLDVRPVMTKYSYFPIVDPRKAINVPLIQAPTFNVQNVFNPGNSQAPWTGFASSVNTESVLRNQIYALQKCSQSVYVPSSESDLYHFSMKNNVGQSNITQPFPDLFKTDLYSDFNPNSEQIAKGQFNNHTRQQLKQASD